MSSLREQVIKMVIDEEELNPVEVSTPLKCDPLQPQSLHWLITYLGVLGPLNNTPSYCVVLKPDP